MAVTATTLRLEQALRDLLDATLDQQLRDLVAAWAMAWDEVAPDLVDTLAELAAQAKTGRIQRGMLVRSQRLTAASAQIAASLEELAQQANIRVVGDLRAVVRRAYEAQRTIIGSQLPYTLDQILGPAPVRDKALDAIVRRSTEQITSLTSPLSAQAYDVVRRELIRGQAVGSNPNHTAMRIVARAEQRFNGGLARAINISRTETVDAHRAAAAEGQAQHPEVLAGWVWLAHLSDRTCQACLGMHGTLHPLSEPGPLGHQQCRCARQARTKSWADLGFGGVPEPVDMTPDADQFFAHLSPDQQKAILGDRGYALWVRGSFPRDAWAVRRSNDGWRDAYYAAKPAAA